MFLEIKQIKKSFGAGGSRVEVLIGIDLEIERGEFCVLLGPSGSGMATLLNIIGGIDGADSGSITIDGERIEDMTEKKLSLYRRKHLGYIFQMYNLIPNLTVRENIEVGAYLSDKPLDVDELLHTLGIYEHQRKLPNQLSGGQQQRTAIGRAIVKNPDILLCDEPTGALDYNTGKSILKLLQNMCREKGMTVIIITHNQALAPMADRLIHIKKRHIEKIETESGRKAEAALLSCQFMLKKVYEAPDNYIYSVFFVEQVANLSRFVDLEKYAEDKWAEYRELAIKYGSNAIRFANNKEWIERAHFALAWIYIHDRNYAYARELIELLPSVSSNRLQESILAQLEAFENGIDAMDEAVTKNLHNIVRAINKENLYAMETFSWQKPLRAVEFGQWAIRLIEVFGENKYLKSYCRGFLRDIYKYLINAEVILGRFENAAKYFEELKEQMQKQYEYHQSILSDEAEKAKFNDRQIGYMEAYTQEFIKEKQQDVVNYILGCWPGKMAEKFAEAIGYSK